MTESVLYETEHWRIAHARDFLVPGYLFVEPQQEVMSLTQLPAHALPSLGPTLGLAVSAVEAVIRPLIVYCAKFGESGTPLHFHVLPRTPWLTDAYRAAFPETEAVSGPVLLDWVAQAFWRGSPKVRYEGNIDETVRALREYVEATTRAGAVS